MPPLTRRTTDGDMAWEDAAKLAFGILGSLAMFLVGWNAYELRAMRDVIYNGHSRIAVIESKLSVAEKEQVQTTERLKVIESRLHKEYR